MYVAKTKALISLAVTDKLICVFDFAYAKSRFSHDAAQIVITGSILHAVANQHFCFRNIVQFLYFLNPKFQASNYLLWLYSLICVGPGWKPRRQFFSGRGSYGETYFRVILAIFSGIQF